MQKQYQQKGPEQMTNRRHTVVRNHTVCRQFYISIHVRNSNKSTCIEVKSNKIAYTELIYIKDTYNHMQTHVNTCGHM